MLHLITSFLLSHLATTYAQLVKDRMVLSAEVMREYDKRFVYKRIFGGRVDRAVQTEQGEPGVCSRWMYADRTQPNPYGSRHRAESLCHTRQALIRSRATIAFRRMPSKSSLDSNTVGWQTTHTTNQSMYTVQALKRVYKACV
jgi:hypothetical protein